MSYDIKYGVLLLDTLRSGESITVTDEGWVSAGCAACHAFARAGSPMSEPTSRASLHRGGAFSDTARGIDNSYYDSHQTYTATSDQPAGTVLTQSDFGTLKLGNSADQILVYTGSKASPTFIAALDNSMGYSSYACDEDTSKGFQAVTCSSAVHYTYFSELPPVRASHAFTNFSSLNRTACSWRCFSPSVTPPPPPSADRG